MSGNAKRPRLSRSASEDDEEDDENVILFSQRLSRFKKPSVKRGQKTTHAIIASLLNTYFQGKSHSMASDNDDFIVPDDSDEETRSTKSGKSSRRSSSQHLTTSEDEETQLDEDDLDLDDDAPKKSTSKGRMKARGGPVRGGNKKTISTSGVGSVTGSSTFLTAAEQREQGRKEEKKATEEPYAFLRNVRDVSNNAYGSNHRIEFWTTMFSER